MAPDSVPLDLLTSKAMLLLRREREVVGLRQERARIEVWIRVFHELSLKLSKKTWASLLKEWTKLMATELDFQAAAVYVPGGSAQSLRLECSESHVPLPNEIVPGPEVERFLADNQSGRYRKGAPALLDAFASAAGLVTFFWLHLTIRGEKLLLLTGFAGGAGKSFVLKEYDVSYFELSGKHLAALLDNIVLIAELDRERLDLAQSNCQLERALSQLRQEMEERSQLERELRHAQKLEALGRMVASIGHEINNPLAYVLTNLEFSRRELEQLRPEVDDARWKALGEALNEATAGGERIRSIVGSTREFSRPFEETPRAIDPRTCLSAALRMVSNELRHRAKLTDTVRDIPRVMADPRRLEQVFVNLLMNAIHALPADGADNEIQITGVRVDDTQIVIRVRDSGRGIPEEHLEHVFEPFFSTRSQSTGMGLGLWVSRGIIESFGGRIELSSRVGHGTVVSVYLPSAPDSTTADFVGALSLSPQSRSSWRPARILLVDDEPAVIRGLRRVLRGHETVMTVSGREGVELCKSGDFDIVFCDLMMPGFSGVDFCRALEESAPTHADRVVLMTGGIVNESIRGTVESTGARCVSKPFDMAELHQLVRVYRTRRTESRPPQDAPSQYAQGAVIIEAAAIGGGADVTRGSPRIVDAESFDPESDLDS